MKNLSVVVKNLSVVVKNLSVAVTLSYVPRGLIMLTVGPAKLYEKIIIIPYVSTKTIISQENMASH